MNRYAWKKLEIALNTGKEIAKYEAGVLARFAANHMKSSTGPQCFGISHFEHSPQKFGIGVGLKPLFLEACGPRYNLLSFPVTRLALNNEELNFFRRSSSPASACHRVVVRSRDCCATTIWVTTTWVQD